MSKETKHIKVTWLEAPFKKWLKENYKQGMSREEFYTLLSKEDITKYVTHSLIE